MSRSSPPLLRDGETRKGHGEGDIPLFEEEVSGPQHCDGHVPATHPRLLFQHAESSSTGDSDRDRQMKPGRDPLLVELF